MKKNLFAKSFGQNLVTMGQRGGMLFVSALDLRGSDQREFVLFPAANGQQNIRVIAAPTPEFAHQGCRFGIRLQNQSDQKMAVIIYVNGKSVIDGRQLSGIPSFARGDYGSHGGKFILSGWETSLKDHAIEDDQTPALCFVQSERGVGYSETDWNYDPSCAHQIQIFAWIETEQPYRSSGLESFGNTRSGGNTRSASKSMDQPTIGLGGDTGHRYQNTAGLRDPKFLGETILVYLSEESFAREGYQRFSVGRHERPEHDPVDGRNDLTGLIPGKYPRVEG